MINKFINRIINRLWNWFITILIIIAVINFLLSYYYIIFATNFYNQYIVDILVNKLNSTYMFNAVIYVFIIGLYLFIYMILFISLVKRLNIQNKYVFTLSNLNIYLLFYLWVSAWYVSWVVNVNTIWFYYVLLPIITLFISFTYLWTYDLQQNTNEEILWNKESLNNEWKNNIKDVWSFMDKVEKDFKAKKEENIFDWLNKFNSQRGNIQSNNENNSINKKNWLWFFDKMKNFIWGMFKPENDDVIVPENINKYWNTEKKENIVWFEPLLPNTSKWIDLDNIDEDLFDIDWINDKKENNIPNINTFQQKEVFNWHKENIWYDEEEKEEDEDNRSIEEKLDLDKILSTDSSQIEEVLGTANVIETEYDWFLLDEDDDDEFISIEEKGVEEETQPQSNFTDSWDEWNINPTKFYLKWFNLNKTQELEKIEEYIYKL